MDSAIDITYEPVDLFGNLLCKIFIHSCSQEEPPFHWHNCYEFSCCFVDDSTLIINGEKHVIKAGQLSFVNANIIHCPLPHKMKTIRGITVLIPVDVAKSYFPTYEETSFQIEDNVFVQKMILKDLIEMYTLSLEPTKTAPLRINSLVLDILAIMFDYSQECPDCVANKNALPKKQYAEYILRNYKKNLTLNEVAQHYGYSKSYFSMHFKKEVGIPFYTFLSSVRLSHAAYLLSNSAMQISEIALESGFTNVRSFEKLFARHYKTSPNQYRIQGTAQNK